VGFSSSNAFLLSNLSTICRSNSNI
jgi:hypothetical protein